MPPAIVVHLATPHDPEVACCEVDGPDLGDGPVILVNRASETTCPSCLAWGRS